LYYLLYDCVDKNGFKFDGKAKIEEFKKLPDMNKYAEFNPKCEEVRLKVKEETPEAYLELIVNYDYQGENWLVKLKCSN